MLEVLIVWSLSTSLGKKAESLGRSKAFGWLFAAGWIVGEVFGFIIGLVFTGGETFGAYLAALVCAVLGGTIAWIAVSSLPSIEGAPAATAFAYPAPGGMPLPDAAVAAGAPVPTPQTPPPAKRRAGYCMDCQKNVWLTGVGACPNGHGPQSLTDCYVVEV